MGVTFGSEDSLHFTLPDGRGKTIIGYDSTQTEFDAVGETGGEKTHALVEAEIPAHHHSGVITAATANVAGSVVVGPPSKTGYTGIQSDSTGSSGSGTGHSNLQPFLVLKLIVRGA
jgi:microcystin-dependent protein